MGLKSYTKDVLVTVGSCYRCIQRPKKPCMQDDVAFDAITVSEFMNSVTLNFLTIPNK